MTDAPWVEPVVSKEKLLFLLAMGTEFPQLDFKQKVDLDEHSELVELAKDVAALQSCGGYLVIGVDDTGKPTEMQSEALAKKFDEANLRQKLENHLVLIHVERHPLGFSVIAKPGEYQAADGRPKVVLRPGDVFIRRGTSRQRWSEDDVEDLLAPRDARLKELHRKDFAALAVELQTGMRGESLASGPANALTWQLDGNTFEATIVETLRHGDMVPIRLFLARALGEATTFAQRADHESFDTITDRLTSLSAIALTVGHDELCHGVVAGLGDLYRSKVFREEGPSNVAGYWLSLITRATALGGLAVHLKKWPVVRQIAMEPSGDDHYGSWLRHGITIEARAHAFPRVDNDWGVPRIPDRVPT